jgi:hypothetical protein
MGVILTLLNKPAAVELRHRRVRIGKNSLLMFFIDFIFSNFYSIINKKRKKSAEKVPYSTLVP